MFVKCANCGYLTPEGSALCKQCGAVASLPAKGPEPDPEVAPAAAIPTMPPPDPASAAPGWGTPPPRPPATPPPVPSMFPEPGARPPRRPLPTWGIVSGALVVVVALIVGGIALTGRDDAAGRRADRINAAAAAQDRAVAALDASLLTRADLGSEWSETDHSGLRPSELVWDQPCSDAPGLHHAATLGRGSDFAYGSGAHLAVDVRQFPSTDDAAAQFIARSAPGFDSCVATFDVEDLECACGRTGASLGITRLASPPGVRAVIFRDTLTYDDNGPKPAYALRAYLVSGRDLAAVSESSFGTPPDPARFAELVTIVGQRIALHAPGD